MLGGSMVWSMAKSEQKYSEIEKRELAQYPKVSWKRVLKGKFQKEYETYLADQIFARDQWVSLYSNMEFYIGKKEINGVYLGNDGYLVEKYTDQDFDRQLQDANIEILGQFIDAGSEVLGKDHVSCLMVPSKLSVLDNKLSSYIEKYHADKVVKKLQNSTKYPTRVVDLQKTLKKHNDEYIYYRTDHHWTTLGAYYGFCEYQKMTKGKVSELKSYKQEVAFDDFYGTTYNKSHVAVAPDEVTIFHTDYEDVKVEGDQGKISGNSFYFKDAAKKGSDRYQIFFSKNTGKIVIETSANNKELKTLLVIKDSFANCFVPFLAQYYDKIVMIDCRYTKMKIKNIFKEFPEITDVLMMFNVEKFRQDTHLSALKTTAADLQKKEKAQTEDDEEDDIFSNLISLE